VVELSITLRSFDIWILVFDISGHSGKVGDISPDSAAMKSLIFLQGGTIP